jgi:hypothetical protein
MYEIAHINELADLFERRAAATRNAIEAHVWYCAAAITRKTVLQYSVKIPDGYAIAITPRSHVPISEA